MSCRTIEMTLDRADPHAGDADVVTDVEPGGVGEVGLVGLWSTP